MNEMENYQRKRYKSISYKKINSVKDNNEDKILFILIL